MHVKSNNSAGVYSQPNYHCVRQLILVLQYNGARKLAHEPPGNVIELQKIQISRNGRSKN